MGVDHEHVLVEIVDSIGRITLNAPGSRNALSESVRKGLIEAVDTVVESDARCLVLAGAGHAFCAGGDIEAMRERLDDQPAGEDIATDLREIHEAVRRVATCRLPTVALVDGPAIGGGASLALACDIQLASDDAVFSFGFRKVGLSVDTGSSHMLPRAIGMNVAKELVLTGETVSADRAAELGLVNHVYASEEFEDQTAEMIEEIADGPTVALAESMALLESGPTLSLRRAMAAEVRAQRTTYRTADYAEGVEAFFADRRPEFSGE